MIKKVEGGYYVVSKTGKKLSKKLKTRAAAERRLAQVEYHKNKGSAQQQKKAFI
jgi:hypothetical protein